MELLKNLWLWGICLRRKRESSLKSRLSNADTEHAVTTNPTTTTSSSIITIDTYIPCDILVEILINLPARSLVRFKYVCKIWFSLIDDPSFVNRHLALAKEKGKGILQMSDSSLYSLDASSCLVKELLPITLQDTSSAGLVKGLKNIYRYSLSSCNRFSLSSCNGLFCFPERYSDFIRVFNPITGETITIPKPSRITSIYMSALCFDMSSRNYNVVCYTDYTHGLQVFTLGIERSSWKCIKWPSNFDEFPWFNKAVSVNGALHWGYTNICHREKGFLQCRIIAFNLASENFTLIFCPNVTQYLYKVCESGGSLAVIETPTMTIMGELNVWVLRDYHKQEWVKQLWGTRDDIIFRQGTLNCEKLIFKDFVLMLLESLGGFFEIQQQHLARRKG
ncbi:hypothetical protein AQUCO_00201243v1 [Aquilegia coerulea]|uniref:F-box domain-containing protein n=1 Tax=Aquilegia coerulea TaxID=218851 RepID=A0A2G5F785_AQUCA|nr:hypothetical protein AQUCO_00201243v1 [Aquilegia coerulea]